jgi:O-antigen/teichoic acid export membrane protein
MDKREYSHKVGTRTARMAGYLFLSRIIAMGIAGIALLVVARVLGSNLFGVYTLAIAEAGLFGMIGDFGIGTTFSKFAAEYSSTRNTGKMGELLSNGMIVLLVFGLLITAAAFLSSGFLASYVLHSTKYVYVLQLASLTIILSMLYTVTNVLIGLSKGGHFTLITTAQTIIQSLTSIALAVLGFGAAAPITGLVAGYAAGTLLALYAIVFVAHIRPARPSMKPIRKMLKFSMPVAASTALANMMTNLAPIVLGVFATTMIVGNYGIAAKVGTLISSLTEAIVLSLLPAFAATIASKRSNGIEKIYNYSVHISLVLATPLLLTIALLSRPFTFTAFGGGYPLAPLYVSVVSIGVLIGIIGLYTSTLLTGSNKVREVLKNSVVLVVVQLVALFALVPAFKGIGLVVVMFIITPIGSVLLYTREAERSINVHLATHKIYRVILAGLISAALLAPLMLALSGNYMVLLIAAAVEQIVAYPPIVAAVKGVTKGDLEVLKSITRSVPMFSTVISVLADYSGAFARS